MRDLKSIMEKAEFIQEHSIMKSYTDYGIILYEFFEKDDKRNKSDKAILFEWYANVFYIIDSFKNMTPSEKRLFELFQELNISWEQFKKDYSEHIEVEFSTKLEIICLEWEKFRNDELERE